MNITEEIADFKVQLDAFNAKLDAAIEEYRKG